MIELRGVEKSYGTTLSCVAWICPLAAATSSPSSALGRREEHSTALYQLVGTPTAGQVVIEGHDITDRSTDLNESVSAWDGLPAIQSSPPHRHGQPRSPPQLLKTPRSAAEHEAEVLLDQVGLKAKPACPPIVGASSSGGHRHR
jgi:hypothetical protein